MVQTLDSDCTIQLETIRARLKKANTAEITDTNLYQRHYQLADDSRNAMIWMLQADGITPQANEIWLRADPVILEATHNGIVCRGNAVLHLANDEQREIETLLNNHFKDEGLRMQFQSPDRGYLIISKATDAEFSPLDKVLGQDISYHLPAGADGRYWQQILMEIQMLLHRAECNEQRRETGERTVDSLWLWGNIVTPTQQKQSLDTAQFYTNHSTLSQIYREQVVAEGIPATEELIKTNQSTEVLFAQLEEACIQNDIETWQSQWQAITTNYIEPMLTAVRNGKISALEIITHQTAYELKPWHRWRFWA